jgi:hypothetical protein
MATCDCPNQRKLRVRRQGRFRVSLLAGWTAESLCCRRLAAPGGDNISWRELETDFVADSLDYISPAGDDVAYIMIRGEGGNKSQPLCLVRARDGAKLWSGSAPKGLPAPYLAQRASGLEPIELPFYRRAIQDIRFHGADYWEEITTLPYADLLGDKISIIKNYHKLQGQLDESPGPWELLSYFFTMDTRERRLNRETSSSTIPIFGSYLPPN